MDKVATKFYRATTDIVCGGNKVAKGGVVAAGFFGGHLPGLIKQGAVDEVQPAAPPPPAKPTADKSK